MAKIKKNSQIDDYSLLDFFYPVGTIYHTTDDNFNPNKFWGGTWKKIENRFLYGTKNEEKSGTTGGEEKHTLTIEEIPSHRHGLPAFVSGDTNYGNGNFIMNWGYQGQYYQDPYWYPRTTSTDSEGGGHITTICHLMSPFISGKELLRNHFNRLLSYKKRKTFNERSLLWLM